MTLESNRGKYRKYLPYVFTEHGVLMLSSVLNSQRAVEMNILIMRAFVKMRQLMRHHAPTMKEYKELKQILMLHIANTETRFGDHESRINQIIRVLDNLIEHPKPAKRIGFHAE